MGNGIFHFLLPLAVFVDIQRVGLIRFFVKPIGVDPDLVEDSVVLYAVVALAGDRINVIIGAEGRIGCLGDNVIGKRVRLVFFAVFGMFVCVGQDDIGGDAAQLGGATADAVEFFHGQLDGSEAAVHCQTVSFQREGPLDSAFAKGRGAADDNPPLIVLDGGGEDLGGGGAEFINHHGEGTGIEGAPGMIFEDHRSTFPAFDLDDGALVDEEAYHFDDVAEGAAG